MALVKVTQLPLGKVRVMSGEGAELGGRRCGFLLHRSLSIPLSSTQFPHLENDTDWMISRALPMFRML